MRLSIFALCFFLFGSSCSQLPQYRFQPYINDLDELFHADSSREWSNQRYKPEDVFDINSAAYKRLTIAGILNKNSKIIFSSIDCISIINSKRHAKLYIEQKDFSDTVVMFNGNEGKFACGIDGIYTMNQDESITSLHISVCKIDAAMNVFIVNN